MAKCVLVVEDDGLIRLDAVMIFEDLGYRVIESENADDALRILSQDKNINLLFTDIEMPGSMDGLGLADIVANRWPNLKVIITSGRVSPNVADFLAAATFLPKPYSPEKIEAAL